jgi:hypothetical protein
LRLTENKIDMRNKEEVDKMFIYGRISLHTTHPCGESAIFGNPSTEMLEKYAYLYKYDDYERMTGKKLPACDW